MNSKQARELHRQYRGALEDWQIRLAIGRIRCVHLPLGTWNDIMQELAIVVIGFRFDPDRANGASERTVLRRAMDNRIRTLARSNGRRLARVERLGRMSRSIQDTHLPDHGAASEELRHIIGELAPLQQEICQGLMDGDSIRQISQRTGHSWATIRNHIRRIHQVFADRGLDQWLA